MMKLAVCGVGRTGSELLRAIEESDRFLLTTAFCRPGSEKADMDVGTLLNRNKTGVLIRAAVSLGALACPELNETDLQRLDSYAAKLGLAFQVIDDVLDCEADTATLGKTAGKDADADKPTYVKLMGLPQARAYAEALVAEAVAALAPFGEKAAHLRGLAEFVTERKH